MTNREDGYMTTHCTNWSTYDVPTIWSTVSDEGDAVSYAQVTAWRETSEAIDKHAAALRAALHDLELAWPPEKSAASQEFLDNAGSVLLVMEQYSSTAATNSESLLTITDALKAAKDKIQQIQLEWSKKVNAHASESVAEQVLDKVTFWSDDNAWQLDLNRKAAAIMVEADGLVSEGKRQMDAPDAYAPPHDTRVPPNVDTHSPPKTSVGADSENVVKPPTIQTLDISNMNAGAILTSTIVAPKTPGDSFTPITTDRLGKLDVPPDTQVAAPATLGLNLGPSITTPSRYGSNAPGPVVTEREQVSRPNQNGPIGRTGLIGKEPMEPGLIAGGLQRGGPTARSSRRVNAPGGVIGSVSHSPQAQGRRSIRTVEDGAIFDPDDPWATTQGVPPVISSEWVQDEHSAGAGVIGIDR